MRIHRRQTVQWGDEDENNKPPNVEEMAIPEASPENNLLLEEASVGLGKLMRRWVMWPSVTKHFRMNVISTSLTHLIFPKIQCSFLI
jgi:hypothetical protein